MNSDPTLWAIDPGPHTGLAIRRHGAYATAMYLDTEVHKLYMMLVEQPPDGVAVELFATGGRVDQYMLRTVEIVGGVKALCVVARIPMHGHRPQERLSYLSEVKHQLQYRSNQPTDDRTQHELDAMAHLMRLEDTLHIPHLARSAA